MGALRTHPLESMGPTGPIFLLAPKSEFMTSSNVPEGDPWATILLAALAEGTKNGTRAATGAKLRQLVEKVARSSGVEYPPEPGLKFGQFLAKHAEIVTLRKRPGADLLVAPADKPDLLVEAANPGRIRQDLFDAFTRVAPQHKAYYDPSLDGVVWLEAHTAPVPKGSVAIPPVTLSAALADRRAFAEERPDGPAKQALLEALETPTFHSFTSALRETGLQREWHVFRTKLLADRIAAWADNFKITWQAHWLTGSSTYEMAESAVSAAIMGTLEPDFQAALGAFVSSLGIEDLRRISVPLDLVARALKAR